MDDETRVRRLNDRDVQDRRFAIYWMQAAQRTEFNHALEYAARRANELARPLVVVFGLTDDFPRANLRHYVFMLEGLREVADSLAARGVRFLLRRGSLDEVVTELAAEASLVVVDAAYTRTEKHWRRRAADALDCPLIQVETNVVVPVAETSGKEEYAARTIRPKIHRKLARYLRPVETVPVRKDSLDLRLDSLKLDDPAPVLAGLNLDRSVPPVETFHGGTSQASALLDAFIADGLDRFADQRNDPMAGAVSHMSPYLHFGQISPLAVALKVIEADSPGEDDYLEELIVRRELSINFVHYNPHYDSVDALPNWCRRTLAEHERDRREYIYTRAQFERAETHDPYWNAAQREMVVAGKMHGYMRMYWGKKLIEWTRRPADAWRIALELNDKYELDGRDANGFAGVAWCFGKHDQAWGERDVFGKVRYMNAKGLRRKFDVDAYVRKIEAL